jgi:hypothetical protein
MRAFSVLLPAQSNLYAGAGRDGIFRALAIPCRVFPVAISQLAPVGRAAALNFAITPL